MILPTVNACLYAALGVGDVVILGVLAACVVLAIAFTVRRRRRGGGCCGCSGCSGCGGCASRNSCGKCRSTERNKTDIQNG